MGRSQVIEVFDATTGALLATKDLSSNSLLNGMYVTFEISGSVRFRFRSTSGSNAIVSGIFFDAAVAAVSTMGTYIGADSTSQGTWKGQYGAEGYLVLMDHTVVPSYASVVPSGKKDKVWSSSTTDARALQKALTTGRIASCWYAPSFNVDINITDQETHDVTFYCLDYPRMGRSQVIEVFDATTGALLATKDLSSSSLLNGMYVTFEISGSVRFRFRSTSGSNAIVSGIFFDP